MGLISVDGWQWRQQGTTLISYEGTTCKKFFFYTVIKRDGKQELSSAFKREVYHHPGLILSYILFN